MTETLELEPDAFWREVTEHNLKVDGPSAGYMWAGRQGRDGWEMYKTRAMNKGWIYQARRVATKTDAGGGSIVTRIQMPAGVTGRLLFYYGIGPASAGATFIVQITDEDNAAGPYIASLAAGASRECSLPVMATASAAHQGAMTSLGLLLPPGCYFRVSSSAALQTETQTHYVAILMSANTEPTWDVSTSAGTVTLAASSISAANTMREVYICPS